MTQDRKTTSGEALAARVNEEIERLHLDALFAAEYLADRDRVRVRRFESDTAVDYPTWLPWSERAIEDLRLFAELRNSAGGQYRER
jgi:hypothetical protein